MSFNIDDLKPGSVIVTDFHKLTVFLYAGNFKLQHIRLIVREKSTNEKLLVFDSKEFLKIDNVNCTPHLLLFEIVTKIKSWFFQKTGFSLLESSICKRVDLLVEIYSSPYNEKIFYNTANRQFYILENMIETKIINGNTYVSKFNYLRLFEIDKFANNLLTDIRTSPLIYGYAIPIEDQEDRYRGGSDLEKYCAHKFLWYLEQIWDYKFKNNRNRSYFNLKGRRYNI